MNAWKSFLDCYLKDKNWKRDLSVKNRGLRMERYVSGSISFMNIVKLSKNKHSCKLFRNHPIRLIRRIKMNKYIF